MILRSRSSLFLSALAGSASLLALSHPYPAAAQQSDQPVAANSSGLEEVVVTARRKEEKAQSVPITMTTFNQTSLAAQNITNIEQLYKDTPGISICCGGGTASYLFIRGVLGSQIYFDGAPQIKDNFAHGLYFDNGSVQVLKGPQGTLFGLASDAGALVVEPKHPTNSFEGFVEGAVGDYGHRESQFTINVPVVDDRLLLRVGGQYYRTDGYIKDLASGEQLNDQNYWLGRAQATFRPTDDFENNILVAYESSNTNGQATLTPGYLDELNPNGFVALVYGYQNVLAKMNRQYRMGFYSFVGYPIPGGEYMSSNQWNIINTTTYDLNDDLTIKNILAYNEVNTGASQNDPGAGIDVLILGSVPNLHSGVNGPQVNYSEELQVLGKALNDKLSFTVGTFQQWYGYRAPHRIQYIDVLGGPSGSASQNDSRTHAVYAQGTYDLSAIIDGLSFTGGYRYNWDSSFGAAYTYNAAGVFQNGFSHTVDSKAPNYTMSLDYQLTPQTLIFVSDTKGYSRAGVNNGANIPAQYQTFQPESLDNIEVGIKTDNTIFGIKTRSNVSFYYGYYDNIQLPTTFSVTLPNGSVSVISPYINAANAHIEGMDSQFTIIPNDSFEFNASAAWSHAAYDKYTTPSGVDQRGQNFVFDPPWTLNFRVAYHLPIPEALGHATFSTVFAYQSHVWNTNQFPQTREIITSAYNSTDMNFTWNDFLGYPGLDASGYITNVTDQHFGATSNVYLALGFEDREIVAPRMWGISMRYSFGPR